ncbi:alpha-endosulfine isoform 2-T2 [Lycaon pictus]
MNGGWWYLENDVCYWLMEDTQEKEGILPERAEEAKLKAKYPSLGQKPGGSDFLMKRLQKGQKYFDSGDYNMAKAKMKNKQLPSAGPDKNLVTGDHIPTPQDLPQRKSSLVTSKLAGFYLVMRDTEAEKQAEGEASSLQGARCRIRSQDPRIMT